MQSSVYVYVCTYMNVCVRVCARGCAYAVFAWCVLCFCLLGTAAPTNHTTNAYHISVITT